MRFRHRALPHRVPQRGRQEGKIVKIFHDGENRPLFRVTTMDAPKESFTLRGHELLLPPRKDPVSAQL